MLTGFNSIAVFLKIKDIMNSWKHQLINGSVDTTESLVISNQMYSKCYISSKTKCNSIDWDGNTVTPSEFLGSFEFQVKHVI